MHMSYCVLRSILNRSDLGILITAFIAYSTRIVPTRAVQAADGVSPARGASGNPVVLSRPPARIWLTRKGFALHTVTEGIFSRFDSICVHDGEWEGAMMADNDSTILP